ncbi:MAG: hypothetical protein ACP5I4_17140, partial [Oceanipulchritudo sp.]
MKTIASTILLLVATSGLHATLLVNDPIPTSTDYDTDWSDSTSNVGYNSGTASWSGDSDYTLSGAGGMIRANSFNTWRGVQLDFGSPLSGQFWFSILMDENSSAGTDSGIAFALENGGYSISSFDGFGVGISGNGNLMTSQSAAAPAEVAGPVAVPQSGGWTLFVAKITVNGGGANDSIDLWAFDNTSSFGLTEVSLGSAIFTSSTVQYGDDVQDIWVGGRIGTGSGAGDFDNIRISDLSGDQGLQEVMTGVAVPEPSTYAMLMGLL